MIFNVYYVGQANFTIIIKDIDALIYDCGVSKKTDWVDDYDFKPEIKTHFNEIFKKVQNVLIVISHTDNDHKNIIAELSLYFQKKGIKVETIMDGNEKTLKDQLEDKKYFFQKKKK